MAPLAAQEGSLRLEVDNAVATAGFYQLRWFGGTGVELQESRDESFASPRVVYEGTDMARVMSGKPDGDFYYRLHDAASDAYSDVVKVTVRHHSLERAFTFFGVGGIVFLATLLLIVTGARADRREA